MLVKKLVDKGINIQEIINPRAVNVQRGQRAQGGQGGIRAQGGQGG